MMRRLFISLMSLASLCVQAQDTINVSSIWNDGSQWDVYYTVDPEGDHGVPPDSPEDDHDVPPDSVQVTYLLRQAHDGYMALEKKVLVNHVQVDSLVQGYIRSERDSVIYVKPVLEDGSIGQEHLLYDFRHPYEYGSTMRYGLINGEIREELIDWQTDSLDYFILNDDKHCLPAWKGVIYKYGYIGGPMELFLMEAAPGKTRRPKPTNVSHVIFTNKGKRKAPSRNGSDGADDVIIPYTEMLTDGTVWECLAVSTEQPEDRRTYTICVDGDRQLGNRCYKQVYSPEYNIRTGMFEEGRKVYIVKPDGHPEVLLDFGLQEGERLSDVESVVDVTQQENQGISYRTITVDTGLDCHSYFAGDTTPWSYDLIEGIGVSKDQYLQGQHFLNDENTISYLLRCWRNGTLVYQARGYEQHTGISEISTGNEPVIYDLQGRRLNKIPQKGFYIAGTKKVICR